MLEYILKDGTVGAHSGMLLHLDKLWANSGDIEAGKGRHSELLSCLLPDFAGRSTGKAVVAVKKLVYAGPCVLEEFDN